MANNMFGPNAGQPFMPSNNYPTNNMYRGPQSSPYNQNGSNFRPNSWEMAPPMQQSPRSIPGRMISNIEEVFPNDVPNDGTIAIFPTNDLQAIYARCIGRDGLIYTTKFVPEVPQKQESASATYDQKWESLNERITKLENRFSDGVNTAKEDSKNV